MEEAAQLQAFGESNTWPWWMAKGPLLPPPPHLPSTSGLPHPKTQNTCPDITSINLWKCYGSSPPALSQHIPLDDLASWRDFFCCLPLGFGCLCFASFSRTLEVVCEPALTFQRQDPTQACSLLALTLKPQGWYGHMWAGFLLSSPRGCVFKFVPMNSLVCNHTAYYKW